MASQIPLLTDIIETGDEKKAGVFQAQNDTGSDNSSVEGLLSQKIEQAIDTALPEIKRQLHKQLLASLSKK